MTFEETLGALHELVGKEVMVGINLADAADPAVLVSLSGPLRKGEPSPGLELLKQMGRAHADDEALQFHVGGTDDPAEKTYFVLRRSTFEEASQEAGHWGELGLSIWAGGLLLTIVTREEAERHVPRSG